MKKITADVFSVIFLIFVFFPAQSFASAKIYRLFDFAKRGPGAGGKVTGTETESIYSLLENHPDLIRFVRAEDREAAIVTIRGFIDNESDFDDYLRGVFLYETKKASYVFSTLWDLGNLKNKIVGFVRREHLVDNEELFWKWLEYARTDDLGEYPFRLRLMIDDSLEGIRRESGRRTLSGTQLQERLLKDPFMEMLVRLSRENEYLSGLVDELMEVILNDPGIRLIPYTSGLA